MNVRTRITSGRVEFIIEYIKTVPGIIQIICMEIIVKGDTYCFVENYEAIDSFDPRSLCREAMNYLKDELGKPHLECVRDYKMLINQCGLTF